jgi:ATP/maltotriose-dependent transcriptional regulator MalT
MVLVSAPAGAGKTTLLAALAHDPGRGPGRDVAWLQVEAVDRDPARFWAGVAAAVDRVRPGTVDAVATAARATGGAGEATVPVLVGLWDARSRAGPLISGDRRSDMIPTCHCSCST